MTAQGQSLTLVHGQEKAFTLAMVDDNGAAIDCTNLTLTWTMSNVLDGAQLIQKSSPSSGIVINSPATAGIVVVTVSTADTTALTPGQYYWDIWAQDLAGNQYPLTLFANMTVKSRVTVLPAFVAPPTVGASGTISLAPMAQVELAVLTLTSSQVALCAAMGSDASAGVQMAPGGPSIPGSSGGIAFVQEETGNASEFRLLARNHSATATLGALWKVVTVIGSPTTTSIPAGQTAILNASPIVPGNGNVIYVGAFGTDNVQGLQVATGSGSVIAADGIGIVLEETTSNGQVNLRAINLNQNTARAVRWATVTGTATSTATLTAGQSLILNGSPIVPGNGKAVFLGAMGLDQVAGCQCSPGGGSLIGSDGVTMVLEETGNAGEVNIRATNLNQSASRSIRWGYFLA